MEIPVGGCFDASYVSSKTRRGRVQDGGTVAPTLCAKNMEIYVYEGKTDMAKKYRIRKLTPRECFRLMGVRDADIDKIQAYPFHQLIEHPSYSKDEILAGMMEEEKRAKMKDRISESQQYKMAGNSIVVDVLMGIFAQIFNPQEPEDVKQITFPWW